MRNIVGQPVGGEVPDNGRQFANDNWCRIELGCTPALEQRPHRGLGILSRRILHDVEIELGGAGPRQSLLGESLDRGGADKQAAVGQFNRTLVGELDLFRDFLLDDLEEVRREFFARDSREGRQVRKKGDLTVDGLPGESLGAANRFWFFRAAGVEPDSKGSGFSNHRRDGDKEGEGSSIAREAGLIGLALLAIEPESGEHLEPGSIRVYAGQEPTVDAGEFLGVDIPQSIHIDRPRERYAGRDFLTFALDDVAGRSRTNRFGFFTRPFFDELGSPPPA